MASVAEALAFVQKVPATGGGSLYEQLTQLVVRVRALRARWRGACGRRAPAAAARARGARVRRLRAQVRRDRGRHAARPRRRARAQVLDERPTDAVDVLETALLVKKAGADARDAAPVVAAESAADAARTLALAGLYGCGRGARRARLQSPRPSQQARRRGPARNTAARTLAAPRTCPSTPRAATPWPWTHPTRWGARVRPAGRAQAGYGAAVPRGRARDTAAPPTPPSRRSTSARTSSATRACARRSASASGAARWSTCRWRRSASARTPSAASRPCGGSRARCFITLTPPRAAPLPRWRAGAAATNNPPPP